MPDDIFDTINDTYDRVLQLRHSWDYNAKEMEEWKKQYINEWAGEVRVARMKVAQEFTATNPQWGITYTGVWFDEANNMNTVESDDEPKGWETL